MGGVKQEKIKKSGTLNYILSLTLYLLQTTERLRKAGRNPEFLLRFKTEIILFRISRLGNKLVLDYKCLCQISIQNAWVCLLILHNRDLQ